MAIKSLLFCVSLVLISTTYSQPIGDNTIESLGYFDLSHYGRSIFGEPDSNTGELLAKYNPETDSVNPEELGSYLEGDILIPLGQARNGLSSITARWPNGIIPYEIRGNFNAFQMSLIEQAFDQYHSKTCIRFKPRSNEPDYISIVSGNTGCWSSVGRVGGRQEVNFQTPGCMNKIGTVIHEFMHACGFLHEQNRSERDGYITVNWGNVKAGTENNFEKVSASTTNAFGVGYDYNSVMHYSAYAFSRNSQPTITAKYSGATSMGQRNGFSEGDVAKINGMYYCGVTYPAYPSGYGNSQYPYSEYTSGYGNYPNGYGFNNYYQG